MYQGTKQDIFV